MKNTTRIFAILNLMFFVFYGCKMPQKQAPPFPPEKNLNIDFSYFTAPENETGYYVHAFNTTLYWANLFRDSLQLYKKALNSISGKNLIYQDDNTWLSSGVFYSGEKKYDVNYFEIINSDTVETKMFFTLDSTYTDLLLFDGFFIPDTTIGYRQINKPDTGNTFVKFLKIDWSVSENKKYIKFTNLLSDKNGDFIIQKDSTDNQFDTYLDFFDKATDNHVVIEYNKISLSGRIKDEYFFGDTIWHCWNNNKQDIDCNSEIKK